MEDAVISESSSPPDQLGDSVADDLTTLSLLPATDTATATDAGDIDGNVKVAADAAEVDEGETELAEEEEHEEKGENVKEEEVEERCADAAEVDEREKEQSEEEEAVVVKEENVTEERGADGAEVEESEKEQAEEEAEVAVVVVEDEERENVEKDERIEEDEDDDHDHDSNSISNSSTNNSNSSRRSRYPVRPEAELCSFYMKTGMCKYGINCKFNHPFRKSLQGGKMRGKEESLDGTFEYGKGRDDSMEKEGWVDCKYFDRPGGCKFGKACKFNHNKKITPSSDLNFMGLPIREGERECPFYMRNGSCKFGASCRFNHPEPTSTSGGPNALPKYGNGGSISSPSASLSPLKSWSPPALKENPAYAPSMFPPTQGVLPRSAWTAYQAPVYQPGTVPMAMAPPYAMNRQPLERTVYSHQQEQIMVDEFPERPGQPECSFFLKTGDCKYKSACKFHHPKNSSEKSSVCSLSELGLPLRPGENICSYYSRYGICKYGPACKYDHPVNHVPSGGVDMTPGFGNPIAINHAMAAGS